MPISVQDRLVLIFLFLKDELAASEAPEKSLSSQTERDPDRRAILAPIWACDPPEARQGAERRAPAAFPAQRDRPACLPTPSPAPSPAVPSGLPRPPVRTWTLDSGRLILSATSSRMKMSG